MTINWHSRSLSPERNWDEFYRDLLDKLKKERTLFFTAAEAVQWFARRRSIRFENIEIKENTMHIRLKSDAYDGNAYYILRCYPPKKKNEVVSDEARLLKQFIDIEFNGQHEVVIKYEQLKRD